jgi:hypothetical protein
MEFPQGELTNDTCYGPQGRTVLELGLPGREAQNESRVYASQVSARYLQIILSGGELL